MKLEYEEYQKQKRQLSVTYNNFQMHLEQPSPGRVKHINNILQISLQFNDIENGYKHKIENYQLKEINYKTIKSALLQEDQDVITCQLIGSNENYYQIIIHVKLQFLNQIQERIVLQRVDIEEKQLENMQKTQKYKEQLIQLQNEIVNTGLSCAYSGKIKKNKIENVCEIICKIPSEGTSILTLSLSNLEGQNWKLLTNNVLKMKLYWYNSNTKDRFLTDFIPVDGLYFIGNSLELRFALQNTYFDSALFVIDGLYDGEYLMVIEKSEPANVLNYKFLLMHAFKLSMLFVIFWSMRRIWNYFGSDSEQQ